MGNRAQPHRYVDMGPAPSPLWRQASATRSFLIGFVRYRRELRPQVAAQADGGIVHNVLWYEVRALPETPGWGNRACALPTGVRCGPSDGTAIAGCFRKVQREYAMKVEESKYSIAEIIDWLNKRELIVNTEYQRGGGLWPSTAKSYFIDTILKDFPFPKVYFHERLDRETKRPRREIVDGQQRLSTILDFDHGPGTTCRGL